jgi:hypothetical protein
MWENMGPDGTATEARTSLAHGWASGPTPILTAYVSAYSAITAIRTLTDPDRLAQVIPSWVA